MTQYGFLFDADACANCKACAAACKDVNDMPVGYKLRKTLTGESGSWTQEGGAFRPQGLLSYTVSIACNHCATPACTAACPTGAMTKDPETGIVSSNHDECIACGSCQKACPYDAPVVVPDFGYTMKCDFCHDRLDRGEEPACVAACMNRCLAWGDIKTLRAQYGDNADCCLLPSSEETSPSLVVLPHRLDPEGATPVRLNSAQEEVANG